MGYNKWNQFLKKFYKEKKELDPTYTYRKAMTDAKQQYKEYVKKEKKMVKEKIKPVIHLIKDPMNYIMPQFLNTHDKIALKIASNYFKDVRLNKMDCLMIYKNNISFEKENRRMKRIYENELRRMLAKRKAQRKAQIRGGMLIQRLKSALRRRVVQRGRVVPIRVPQHISLKGRMLSHLI